MILDINPANTTPLSLPSSHLIALREEDSPTASLFTASVTVRSLYIKTLPRTAALNHLKSAFPRRTKNGISKSKQSGAFTNPRQTSDTARRNARLSEESAHSKVQREPYPRQESSISALDDGFVSGT